MNTHKEENGLDRSDDRPDGLGLPTATIVISFIMLVVLAVVVYRHLGDAAHFAETLERAEPGWLGAAVFLQICTYCSAGAIWGGVVSSGGYRLRLGVLARLAVEKLTIDQLIPMIGMAGNITVVRAMRRFGLPGWLAMEAIIIDILSRYAAYLTVVALTVAVLWLHHDITPIVRWLLAGFALVAAIVPLTVIWLLRNRHWRPPVWLGNIKIIRRLMDTLSFVSAERVGSPLLITRSAVLQAAIFFLDAGTLWCVLRAIGVSAEPVVVFSAIVIASVAATVSFIPGGIGSFEAGCTATLTLLGIPIEAALTGTLLLRGLTLWLPLIPGFIMAHRDIAYLRRKSE